MDIRTCIQHLAPKQKDFLAIATVVSVDSYTCTVQLADGTEIPEVRLRALNSNEGALLITPKINSEVIIAFLDRGDAIALLYSEADKIQFNQGNNGGLVIASKITQALNTIEQQLNQLKTILNAWTPVPSDGGLSLKTAITTWTTQTINNTTEQQISNNKITH